MSLAQKAAEQQVELFVDEAIFSLRRHNYLLGSGTRDRIGDASWIDSFSFPLAVLRAPRKVINSER